MLDDIEHLAWTYVHNYAKSFCCDSLDIVGHYGDVLEYDEDNDDLGSFDEFYIHDGRKWNTNLSRLYIWKIHPYTGFFIFSDYWKNVAISVSSMISFDHTPYINQLLVNAKIGITRNKQYVAHTDAIVHGFKCTIVAKNANNWKPKELMSAFKRVLNNRKSLHCLTAFKKINRELEITVPLAVFIDLSGVKI